VNEGRDGVRVFFQLSVNPDNLSEKDAILAPTLETAAPAALTPLLMSASFAPATCITHNNEQVFRQIFD